VINIRKKTQVLMVRWTGPCPLLRQVTLKKNEAKACIFYIDVKKEPKKGDLIINKKGTRN
jgi:hypothetical protein